MTFQLIREGKKLLRRIDFFAPFDNTEIDVILALAQVKKFHLQDLIIAENCEGYTFYVILEGAAKVVKGLNTQDAQGTRGSAHKLAVLTTGDCFGEIAILLGEKRSASVLAGVGCVLFEIDGDGIGKLDDTIQKKIFRQFAVNLAKRLIISSVKK